MYTVLVSNQPSKTAGDVKNEVWKRHQSVATACCTRSLYSLITKCVVYTSV